ncbi:LON peptidase substrate-binding domain-containing protein [Caenispirillum bisanense]|uniref:LON peptidase substrate-binding domain-containing protein n=1 Tax=Caenispirillum bisanense TaxID=414052 RepID=UPI0031DB5F95
MTLPGPFHPRREDLPDVLPIFPLGEVLLLPGGRLPLNIFEPRYLAMTLDALGAGRMIGMVLPLDNGPPAVGQDRPAVFSVGCAGRISSFSETDDGRLLITLTGVCRFAVGKELPLHRGYRRVQPQWDDFAQDLALPSDIALDRPRLMDALKAFALRHRMQIDPQIVAALTPLNLVTSLAMLCPFSPVERQALLEADTPQQRADTLVTLLEMGAFDRGGMPSGGPQ